MEMHGLIMVVMIMSIIARPITANNLLNFQYVPHSAVDAPLLLILLILI